MPLIKHTSIVPQSCYIITLTKTLIAKRPKTAPEDPRETADRGRTNHETKFAPTPVKM